MKLDLRKTDIEKILDALQLRADMAEISNDLVEARKWQAVIAKISAQAGV